MKRIWNNIKSFYFQWIDLFSWKYILENPIFNSNVILLSISNLYYQGVKETVLDVNVIYHNTTWEILTEIGVKTYHPTLNFLCAFSTLNFTDLYYNIEWYIGDNFVKHVSVNESELDQAILTSEDMIKNNKKMGEKVSCKSTQLFAPLISIDSYSLFFSFYASKKFVNIQDYMCVTFSISFS